MPKLVTWMNNQRVGELTKLANGAHTFKYAPEWLASRYARPLSLSLPLQRGNITSDAVFNFFDNLLPDSPIVRDRIVKRYHAKSRQPFDLLSEIGRDSVGAVTLIPEDETVTHPIMAWEKLTEARLEEVLTAYKADIPLGMIREENDFRIFLATAKVLRFPEVQMHEILSDFARMIPAALDNVKTSLPTDFPENVVTAVESNVLRLHGRLSREYGSK
ncbi:type II toxin-antitoxin system HipA family toxin [Escherichia coli]|nr:type II toxin-antitoxin system HipA family toxin [Escherichia coli]